MRRLLFSLAEQDVHRAGMTDNNNPLTSRLPTTQT